MAKIAVEWFYNELKNLIKESELTEMNVLQLTEVAAYKNF